MFHYKYQILKSGEGQRMKITRRFIELLTHALQSDREQPAVIEADEVELDFNTGERIYKGNVVVEQGTLLIKGDKMVVKYKEDKMETATAWGNPASFKQRPDGKDQDVLGKGRIIVLNQIRNTLTLTTNASLKQGPDWANGEIIIYNMDTDKMTIKSTAGGSKKAKAGAEPGKKKRARVIIMPAKRSSTPASKTTSSKSNKEVKPE
jgi:lipopolysaccharide export system protein LptA